PWARPCARSCPTRPCPVLPNVPLTWGWGCGKAVPTSSWRRPAASRWRHRSANPNVVEVTWPTSRMTTVPSLVGTLTSELLGLGDADADLTWIGIRRHQAALAVVGIGIVADWLF